MQLSHVSVYIDLKTIEFVNAIIKLLQNFLGQYCVQWVLLFIICSESFHFVIKDNL